MSALETQVKRIVSESHSQLTTVGSGPGRVKCETKLFFVAGQVGWFVLGNPVFTPPKRLTLFEMKKIILKGRKPKSWLKSFI